MRRYYAWATDPARRRSTRFWLFLPYLSVLPSSIAASRAIGAFGADRLLLLVALLPIPLWAGYCWYRLAREIAPHLRGTRSHWRAGWRAAAALMWRSGKSR